jgi:hypothetical protein
VRICHPMEVLIPRSEPLVQRFAAVLGATLVLLLSSSCNVYAPISGPSSDAQYLSVARACFDRGDLTCAKENYAKVTVTYADDARAEKVLAILDSVGLSLTTFVEVVGTGGSIDPGKVMTSLSKKFVTTAGETTRTTLVDAYREIPSITDSRLRGFARFLTSLAILGELLAEDAGTDQLFTTADLVESPSGCNITQCGLALAGIPTATACLKPSGKSFVAGPSISELSGATADQISGSKPTFNLFHAAVKGLMTALSASELGGAGGLTTSTTTFSGNVLDQISSNAAWLPNDTAKTQDAPCYRYLLLSLNVGK